MGLGALLALTLLAAPVDTGAAGVGVVTRLDVSAWPEVRAWVRFALGPGQALQRVRQGDLRMSTESGAASVTGFRPAVEPPRRLLLILPPLGAQDAARSVLGGLATEFAARGVATDSIWAVAAGDSLSLVYGPAPGGPLLAAVTARLPVRTSVTMGQLLGRARRLLETAGKFEAVLLVLPAGASPGSTSVTRIAEEARRGAIPLVIVGGLVTPARARVMTTLRAVDGGSDPAAGLRGVLMPAPGDSTMTYEVLGTVPRTEEGRRQQLSVEFVPPVPGLEGIRLLASAPFLALAPGRSSVGAERRQMGMQELAPILTLVFSAVSLLALAGLLWLRMTRSGRGA